MSRVISRPKPHIRQALLSQLYFTCVSFDRTWQPHVFHAHANAKSHVQALWKSDSGYGHDQRVGFRAAADPGARQTSAQFVRKPARTAHRSRCHQDGPERQAGSLHSGDHTVKPDQFRCYAAGLQAHGCGACEPDHSECNGQSQPAAVRFDFCIVEPAAKRGGNGPG